MEKNLQNIDIKKENCMFFDICTICIICTTGISAKYIYMYAYVYIHACMWCVYIYIYGRYIYTHHIYHMYHMIVQTDVCLKQTHIILKLYICICTCIPKHVFYIWKYERICKYTAKILKDAYEFVGETLKWIFHFML